LCSKSPIVYLFYIKLIESNEKTVDRHIVVVSDLKILREGARKVGEQGQG
jgi:hypothetical protein